MVFFGIGESMIRNEKGFTYIEVVIAFMLFGLMLLIMLRISNSVNKVVDSTIDTNKMLHVAKLELENYKSGIDDIDGFTSVTNFIITSENADSDGNIINRSLIHTNVDGRYTVVIQELMITNVLKEITVTVNHNQINIEPIVLKSKIIKNSE